MAAGPEAILEGNIFRDVARLREVMAAMAPSPGGRASAAGGGLYGWVGFDGAFRLGVFPVVEWAPLEPAPGLTGRARGPRMRFEPGMSRGEFVGMVRRAQEWIAAGDIYQANLSYPWMADWPRGLEAPAFYERLRAVSPASHAAYLELAGTTVISASPECFLRMSGRRVLTRPIKGTRPRGRDEESDARFAEELRASPKERAELVMITDLERNDLGRVCEYGSVRVTEMLRLDRLPHVHHLVSTVEGTLRGDVDHLAAFIACFPGGSISGAPKKRALEIIRELEPHPRGPYTGAIGGFGFDGESHFSIAIRTAWRTGDVARFHTGAGIVADSVPDDEYEETRHKAAGLLQAAEG